MTPPYRLPEVFDTDRYHLRRARPGDAQAIFEAYATDPVVARYLVWTPDQDVAAIAGFLAAVSEGWDRGTCFPLVVFSHANPDDLLGMFEVRLNGSRANYGYVLRSSVWGQGCASEVLRGLVDHALSHPAIFRAEAFCDVDNTASARVMQKAGMTREGILRRYAIHPNISDRPRDCVVYAKVR